MSAVCHARRGSGLGTDLGVPTQHGVLGLLGWLLFGAGGVLRTILVLGADSVEALMANAQRTQLWELWKSDEVRDMTREMA